MVRITVSFFFILFLISKMSFAQLKSVNDLIGVWAGNQIRVEFIDRSNVTVLLPDGGKHTGTYYADFFHSPLVLEMSFNDGNGKIEFKCLVESVQPNSIKWELFEKSAESPKFTGSFSTLNKVRH